MIWQDLTFLGSPELLFQRGAMVLKFGKNFIFRSEIANFWNPFAATDTRQQQRKSEKWSLSFIQSWPDFIMKSVRNKMSLYLGEKQYFYKKIFQFFVIWQIKFLKFIVFIYLVLDLMLPYSAYIYPVVLTYKTCQNIFVFCLENGLFYIQVYFGKCMLCCSMDIRALLYYENDVHIVNISNGNSIYYVLWYHIKYWHTLKEGQVTLDRSPEFMFKTFNLYVSIKNWPCSGEPLVEPFCPQSSIWSKFEYGPSTGWYQGSRPIGFKPGD